MVDWHLPKCKCCVWTNWHWTNRFRRYCLDRIPWRWIFHPRDVRIENSCFCCRHIRPIVRSIFLRQVFVNTNPRRKHLVSHKQNWHWLSCTKPQSNESVRNNHSLPHSFSICRCFGNMLDSFRDRLNQIRKNTWTGYLYDHLEIFFEYTRSIFFKDRPDSFNLDKKNFLSRVRSKKIITNKNSFLLANTFCFHKKGYMKSSKIRKAINFNFKKNPFFHNWW